MKPGADLLTVAAIYGSWVAQLRSRSRVPAAAASHRMNPRSTSVSGAGGGMRPAGGGRRMSYATGDVVEFRFNV